MHRSIHRRTLLQAGAATSLVWLLPQARACEFFTTTLRVTHPWTRASAAGATSAIVSMRFDEVSAADRLIGIDTPVATGAVIGGSAAGDALDFLIPPGRETLLGESGAHLLLTGLTQPLELGRAYPLRLVFARGGIVNADLSVDYPAHA